MRALLAHKARAEGCGCADSVTPLALARQRGGRYAQVLERMLTPVQANGKELYREKLTKETDPSKAELLKRNKNYAVCN